jgi:hypothetical protein
MVSQGGKMIRKKNAQLSGGNGGTIPLERSTPARRGQISHLQFRRAAVLHGTDMNRAFVHHFAGVAMRSHPSRDGSLRASLRGTKRSTGRGHNQSQKRHQTGNPCQPACISQWHDAFHSMNSKLRRCPLGVNLAVVQVVRNTQARISRRSRASLCLPPLCRRKSGRRR